MAQKLKDVDQYLQGLEPSRREALQRIRAAIFETVPDVEETMKYRMPTYELDEVVCAFASQKQYMSLYMDTTLVEKHKEALKHLNCGKSCIRFRHIDELPLDTVKRILEETVQHQQSNQE